MFSLPFKGPPLREEFSSHPTVILSPPDRLSSKEVWHFLLLKGGNERVENLGGEEDRQKIETGQRTVAGVGVGWWNHRRKTRWAIGSQRNRERGKCRGEVSVAGGQMRHFNAGNTY